MSISRAWVYGLCWGVAFIALAAPHATFAEYGDRVAGGAVLRIGQTVCLLTIGLGLLQLGVRQMSKAAVLRPDSMKGFLLILFFTGALLTTLLNLNDGSGVAQVFATGIIFLAASTFWILPPNVRQVSLRVAGIGLFGVVLLTISLYGLPSTRTVGGVQPNTFAKIAFVGSVFLFIAGDRLRWLWLAGAMGVALIVNSRGAVVAVLLFVGIKAVLAVARRPTWPRLISIAGLVVVMASATIPTVLGTYGVVDWVAEDVFRLDDPNRGLGTGLTGRADRWTLALAQVAARPLQGHGFQASSAVLREEYRLWEIGESGAHSGFLNLTLDVGIPLALVWCLILAIVLWEQVRTSLSPVTSERRAAQIGNTVGVLSASLFFWTIEPVYINVGHIFGLSFILILLRGFGLPRTEGGPDGVAKPTP